MGSTSMPRAPQFSQIARVMGTSMIRLSGPLAGLGGLIGRSLTSATGVFSTTSALVGVEADARSATGPCACTGLGRTQT